MGIYIHVNIRMNLHVHMNTHTHTHLQIHVRIHIYGYITYKDTYFRGWNFVSSGGVRRNEVGNLLCIYSLAYSQMEKMLNKVVLRRVALGQGCANEPRLKRPRLKGPRETRQSTSRARPESCNKQPQKERKIVTSTMNDHMQAPATENQDHEV